MPRIDPLPPINVHPPMTHAAIASNSKPRPPPGCTLPTLLIATTPDNAAQPPAIEKAINFTLLGLIPIAIAASGFPPTAKK